LPATSNQIISISKFLRKKKISSFKKIVEQIWEKKGFNVVAIDISAVSSIADFLILCSATSSRHSQTIADEIEKNAKMLKKTVSVEGYQKGDWILVDMGSLIIHIFTEETRDLYDLEGLWHGSPSYIVKEEPVIDR